MVFAYLLEWTQDGFLADSTTTEHSNMKTLVQLHTIFQLIHSSSAQSVGKKMGVRDQIMRTSAQIL